jgi:TorA maturation chaperone TorD
MGSTIPLGRILVPATASTPIAEEDLLRAQMYGFLSGMLLAPPDQASLASVAAMSGDESDIGRAFAEMADAARQATPRSVAEEYQNLFIGVGRGELVPYGSYYLTGFLNEKPLAELRGTLGELGIARADGVKEPEDHIGSLCEVMGGLITGQYGSPASLETQGHFFGVHIAPWASHFFNDLETAKTAETYRPLGRIGAAFMAIERQAFEMD